MSQTIPADRPGGVERVEAWLCRLPLPRPLELAGATLEARDYAVVRLSGGDGAEGAALGLTRSAPIDVVVTELLGPGLAGTPLHPEAIASRCRDLLKIVGDEGLARRAASLLELAAWDAWGRAAGVPVWRLIAPEARPEPPAAMLVEGYALAGESPAAFGERFAEQSARGFELLKLARQPDPEHTVALLAAAREAVGPGAKLTVDGLWSWERAEDAASELEAWEPHDVHWVEDPFPRERLELLPELRRRTSIPVAFGDEVTRPAVYDELAGGRMVDVARVDATTVGGLSAALAVHARVAPAGLALAPHVFPEVHRHLACALPGVGPVECFRPEAGFDSSHLITTPAAISGGRFEVPEEPGFGLGMDWEAVEGHALRHGAA
jgi:L-alanine-DL-glutamate epimerase-like enolase superfamily enzyme